jgi:hypothetical protein
MKKNIIHIHAPKTGGTWLNKTLEEYAPEAFLKSGNGDGNRCSVEDVLVYRGRWNPPSSYFYAEAENAVAGRGYPKLTDIYHPSPRWTNSHKVSVCRNPFDYLVSKYHFDDPGNPHLEKLRHYLPKGVATGAGQSNLRHGIRSFDEYLEKYCDPDFPWHGTQEVEDGQRYFLFHQMFNHDGTCGVDVIIRQEKLSFGTAVMLKNLGHINDGEMDKITNSKKLNVGTIRKKRDYRSYYTDAQREMVERKCRAELLLYGYDFDGPTDDSAFVDPTSLFYHAIVPIAGKFLDRKLQFNYDHGLRHWLNTGTTGDPAADEVTSDPTAMERWKLSHIWESQSIYPDVWLTARGVRVKDEKGGEVDEPHVHVLGNPLSFKAMVDKWWTTEQSPMAAIDGQRCFFDKASFRDVMQNPDHPHVTNSSHQEWNSPDDIDTSPHMWQGPEAHELSGMITEHMRKIEITKWQSGGDS